ncbi:MAG: DUF3772 domain-containing protein [Roseobacter sp.]
MNGVLRAFLTFCFAVLLSAASAQDDARPAEDPLYPFWEEVSANAEQSIDDAENINIDQLETLRSRLSAFRTEFSNARRANADRISAVQSQLDALGVVPENGSEPAEITATRAELAQQLSDLEAPVRVADIAFRRADGLIGEIDRVIRDRQARRLLLLGPSPLDPRNWPTALSDTRRITTNISRDVADLSDAQNRTQLKDQLPLILVLVVFSVTLIFKGPVWAAMAIEYMRRFGGRGTGVWRFLVSLLRIAIPLLGVYVLAVALRLTGLFGERVEDLLSMLPFWGGLLLGFRWLAERLFAREDEDALVAVTRQQRRSARVYMLLLSILFVSRGVILVVFDLETAADETVAVLSFPIVILMGITLFCMGLKLRKCGLTTIEPSADTLQKGGMHRVMRGFANAMMVVGICAPLMAAVGYSEAGNALLYPTVLSLVILGMVIVLQRFSSDLYGLITGQGADARESLAAIFAGFSLTLAVMPLLALIWGARVTDLTELWTQFLQGFDIGGTRISPATFLKFVVVFVLGYTITRFVQSTLRQNVLPKTRIDIGGQNALISGVGYIGIFLAALIAVTVAGIDLSALAIVAGALSVGIGFGLQTIVSNFVSGIILLVERPISEGDWIEVGGQMGYVKHISVRSTRIETFDRTDVIVPNSDLISGTVTNYTRGNTVGRLIVKVGVAYGTDTKKVDAVLREIAEAQPMVMMKPPPSIVFMGFGADSLDFEIRAILRDVNWILSVQSDINHEIAARFEAEGIEIPFAQRDVWLRNPEVLHPAQE